jgi:hypothetical protein
MIASAPGRLGRELVADGQPLPSRQPGARLTPKIHEMESEAGGDFFQEIGGQRAGADVPHSMGQPPTVARPTG